MNQQIKNFALSYIKRGFSIMPIGKNKVPLLSSWKKYQNERATEVDLEKWLVEYPEMQIGIITGEISDLVVIDIDSYKDGFKIGFDLPETRTAKTGSGGRHYYYKYPKGEKINNSAHSDGKWDVRGNGGYIVAPPSENEKGKYEFLNKLETAELPKEIIEKIKKPEIDIKPVVQKNYGGTIFDQLSSFDCRTGLEMLSGTQAVNGEIYTFRKRSGGGYHIDINGKPANCWITPEGTIGSGSRGVNGNVASPTLNQWLGWFGHSPQKKAEIIKKVFGFSDKPIVFEKSKSINSYTWGLDCIDEKITTPKKGEVFVLVADENEGKSTFCYFFARANKNKYGHRVVYFNLEQSRDEVINNIATQWAGASKIEVRDNKHLEMEKYVSKFKELKEKEDVIFIGREKNEITTIESIEKRVAMLGDIDYLIIDNLTCISMSERKSTEEEIKEITLRIMNMASAMNIPIVLVHHYKKRQQGNSKIFRDLHEMSGSRVLKDLVPVVIQVARIPDPQTSDEEREFHLREGKLRRGDKKESVVVHHRAGEFESQHQNWEEIPNISI